MNTNAKGSRNERRSIAILEAAGYRCTRSAASLGHWDIIAVSQTEILFIQVKTRDWPSANETEELKLFPAPPNCTKVIHRWRARQRMPDIREVK